MAINITQDYSRFYIGSESIKSYGSGGEGLTPKDTLVKYEFNTTDEHGNKIMDPMTKEEALQAMKEISGQYGDNVLVEFSGDGLQALSQSLQNQIQKGDWKQLTQEQKADRAGKQELLDKSIVHLENTHRLVIPNIQTNAKLYDSLENAPEQVVKAANGIIKNYLLPHDVSGMTETQRRDTIAFGLEEARYLAENYLDEQHGKDFLAAMETIARYGMGGTVSENGKVTYHIEQGPLVGAPDDYVSESDILKTKAPGLYKELQDLNYMRNAKSPLHRSFYAMGIDLTYVSRQPSCETLPGRVKPALSQTTLMPYTVKKRLCQRERYTENQGARSV